ncbi:MAG: hypothetical protein R8M45_00255 [Ghiorsea sp.]
MSLALYSNNAESITAASILAADLTLTLATGDGALFPAPTTVGQLASHAIVTLTDGINFEIIKVTANAADVMTIVRAQEGTTALDWAGGTTVSQRLTAAAFQSLLDMVGPYDNGTSSFASVRAGIGTTADGNTSVGIGRACTASGIKSTAMGALCTASGIDTVCVGYNSTASDSRAVSMGRNCTSSYDHTTAVGNFCRASGYYSVSVGYGCNSTGYKAVAVGHGCFASGNYATALGTYGSVGGNHAVGISGLAVGNETVVVGRNARCDGVGAVAVGRLANSTGANATAVGISSRGSAVGAVAMGANAQATATNAVAIGEGCINALPDSALIQGAIAIRNTFASTAPHRDFAGAEVVFMTEALSLTAIGNKVITMPLGSVFLPTSAGIMVTDQTGVITTQATVQVSMSTDNITFTPLTAAAITTALAAARTHQDLAIGVQTSSGLYLKGEVTVAGVSTLLYNARFYFKGIVVQE